ncbi:MAG: hypothetical protein EHM42_10655 [Planctomycetaceae bacterium]|nr:MAG: hypothetical protein EHM42_10655 [Planctomycetaceae bacterium]
MTELLSPSFILLVTRDLLFESRVTGAATALTVQVKTTGALVAARQIAAEPGCQCVLYDLSLGTAGLAEFVQELRASRPVPVIAFGSHVATALLESARAAGCSEVMPRSRFVTILPDLLARFGGQGHSP